MNPACSKCRAATAALDEAGVEYTVRRYLEEPPPRDELMLKVHTEGRAVVSTGTRERCEHDASRLHAHGLWATITQA